MRRRAATLVTLIAVSTAGLAAVPPSLLNYQGVLRSNTDAPLSGSYDITCRFFSAAIAGDEILVDRHTAAVGAPVTVSGGLFNLTLGGGSVADGAGPGTYTSLADVFRDYGSVFLAVQVGSETLSPRTQIVATAFALNSATVGGKAASTLLDTSSTAQTKNGAAVFDASLTGSGYGVRALGVDGGLYASDATGSGHSELGKDDYGVRGFGSYPGGMGGYFKDTAYTGEAWVADGDFGVIGYGGNGGGGGLFRHGTPAAYDAEVSIGGGIFGVRARGPSFGGYFEPNNFSSFAYLGLDGGGAYVQGTNYAGFFREASGGAHAYLGQIYDNGLFYEHVGADIYGQTYGLKVSSDATGISVIANEGAAGEFATSSPNGQGYARLAIQRTGVAASGTYGGCDFCSAAVTTSDYAYTGRSALSDGDVGVLGHGSYAGGVFRHVAGASYDTYANLAGGGGSGISSNGTKNFVQNHPYWKDKVIEYASLEGDEVGVYTRGSARLQKGHAEVELSGTFQWVTNPELGLTAQVTPRGVAVPLAVESVSTTRLVVIGPPGSDVEFDYTVNGLRIGFEAVSVVTDKLAESPIPSLEFHRQELARSPELAVYSPLTRFQLEALSLQRTSRLEMPQAAALERAIGVDAAGVEPVMSARLLTPEHQADFDARVARGEIKLDLSDVPSREALRHVSAGVSTGPTPPPAPPAPTAARVSTAPVDFGGTVGTVAPAWPAFAIPVNVAEAVEAGDLVSNDPLRPGALARSRQPNDRAVIGIVAGDRDSRWSARAPLALAGTIVMCKVDASSAPVAANDLLVASATPGYAMRAEATAAPGTILAKALEPLEAGSGMIRVLVMSR